MSGSTQGGVIRLLLGFLEDARMPHAVRTAFAGRADVKFVENLLRKTGPRLSRSVSKTLVRFDCFAWAKPNHEVFKQLDGAAQYNAVQLLMASSMDRGELFEMVKFLLSEGKPGGRRAAAEHLAQFEGAEADALAVAALSDPDPGVRANLIRQIRTRPIPNTMSLLTEMVDDPHEEVRQALREALPEFTYQQFLANFESLPDDLLPTAGHLVRRIDVDVRPRLTEDMENPSRLRRRRAVSAAAAMGLVRELESCVIERLSDEDHMVRVAAANALAECDTMPTWDALRSALLDRSVIVQRAAEKSLTRIAQSLQVQVEEAAEEAVP
jgi:HEAT repeat protein